MPNKQQDIIGRDDGIICWRIYASLGLGEDRKDYFSR